MCGQAEGDLTARAHACLVYEHRDRVREAGPRWLRAGLERGERALVVSARGRADLREDLDGLGDVEGLIREGALVLLPPSEAYGGRGAPSPAASLAAYAAVTQRALTDGFSGLRVLADAPSIVGTPEGARAFAAWEAVADRFMAARPMRALCCYERAVGDDALALLGGMHRHVEGPVADLCPVRVFALPGAVGVAGELDVFAVPLLERLLQMTAPAGTLDLGGLRFVDHHGLAAVAAHLDRHPGMRIARLSPVARRLAALTGITLPGG